MARRGRGAGYGYGEARGAGVRLWRGRGAGYGAGRVRGARYSQGEEEDGQGEEERFLPLIPIAGKVLSGLLGGLLREDEYEDESGQGGQPESEAGEAEEQFLNQLFMRVLGQRPRPARYRCPRRRRTSSLPRCWRPRARTRSPASWAGSSTPSAGPPGHQRRGQLPAGPGHHQRRHPAGRGRAPGGRCRRLAARGRVERDGPGAGPVRDGPPGRPADLGRRPGRGHGPARRPAPARQRLGAPPGSPVPRAATVRRRCGRSRPWPSSSTGPATAGSGVPGATAGRGGTAWPPPLLGRPGPGRPRWGYRPQWRRYDYPYPGPAAYPAPAAEPAPSPHPRRPSPATAGS